MNGMDIKKDKWEESYKRGENAIFYPKEEVVKFLNRFIVKRKNVDEFEPLLKTSIRLKGLDFGCGVGRNTALMHEFGIDGYGIDISQNAINIAKKLSKQLGFNLDEYFSIYDGENLPFCDEFFDFTVCESVLDSLPYKLAKKLIKEIDRISKKFCYVSLISSQSLSLFRCAVPMGGGSVAK